MLSRVLPWGLVRSFTFSLSLSYGEGFFCGLVLCACEKELADFLVREIMVIIQISCLVCMLIIYFKHEMCVNAREFLYTNTLRVARRGKRASERERENGRARGQAPHISL